MIPNEWRKSILVHLYKSKGENQSYSKYNGIKLVSYHESLKKCNWVHVKVDVKTSENKLYYLSASSTYKTILGEVEICIWFILV